MEFVTVVAGNGLIIKELSMASIKLNKVIKRFGNTVTLHNVNLDIADGEFTVFVGPSGCG